MKPNEPRLDASLKYCLVTLLEQLPKGFGANIVFCMTNARGVMYGIGETGRVVRELLKELEIEKGEN